MATIITKITKKFAIFALFAFILGSFFTLCNENRPKEQLHAVINTKTIHKELELKKLFETWNRTKTVYFGPNEFFFISALPIASKDTLLHRQSLIKTIAQEDELFEKLSDALSSIASTESTLLLYLDGKGDLFKELQRMYSSSSLPNSSPLTLSGWFGLKMLRANLYLFAVLGIKSLFYELTRATNQYVQTIQQEKKENLTPSLQQNQKDSESAKTNTNVLERFSTTAKSVAKEGYKFFRHIEPMNIAKGTFLETARRHSPWRIYGQGRQLTTYESEQAFERGYPVDIYDSITQSTLYEYLSQRIPFAGKFLSGTAIAIILGRTLYEDYALYDNISNSITNMKSNWYGVKQMREICVTFRQFFKTLTEIVKLQKQYKISSPLLTDIKQTLQDPDIKEIISLLFSDTFKDKKSSIFFHYGKVMYTQKKIRDNIAKFKPLLKYIGELDAYRSIAQIYREQQTTDKKFCFVKYTDKDSGAALDCHNAWLALIPRESVVQNIHLGVKSGNAQHMCITGPNWSGKSMYLKMTGLVAYLAQTWGIVPAETCSMTIFDYIETCLDPKGDLSQGLSKFAKQKECVSEITDHIHECNSGKIGLFLIDEIFNGTVDDIIALKTIEFAESVAQNNNVIIQITTHIHEPTTLEQTTSGKFKNFHVEIIPQEDGTFIRTFKVVPGAATWWFDQNKKQLRAQFSDWIDEELKKKRKITQEQES